MSKTKRALTTSDVKTLVNLNETVKEAKKAFEDTKAELVPESVCEGKYVVEGVGCVQKVSIVQTVIDYKKLIEDHPEINLKKYTTYKDAPRILITSAKKEDKSFIQKLLNY